MDYIYTKLIVSVIALLILIYIYGKFFKKDSVIYYERKVNNFYYQNKLFFSLVIILIIIGIITFRLEKEVKKRKDTIDKYSLMIAIIIYLKIKGISQEEKSKLKEKLESIFDNEKFKSKSNKMEDVYKEKCPPGSVCPLPKKKEKPFNLDKELEKQIKILSYASKENALRNAILDAYRNETDENWEYVLDILTDELEQLVPNVKASELCGALGGFCIAAFQSKNFALGLANLFKTKSY